MDQVVNSSKSPRFFWSYVYPTVLPIRFICNADTLFSSASQTL